MKYAKALVAFVASAVLGVLDQTVLPETARAWGAVFAAGVVAGLVAWVRNAAKAAGGTEPSR